MGLFRRSLIISFKEKSIFRFDYLVGTVFAFFYIVLKVSLWKGLYGVPFVDLSHSDLSMQSHPESRLLSLGL